MRLTIALLSLIVLAGSARADVVKSHFVTRSCVGGICAVSAPPAAVQAAPVPVAVPACSCAPAPSRFRTRTVSAERTRCGPIRHRRGKC